MIDTHDYLAKAWKEINWRGRSEALSEKRQTLLEELVAPPCPEAYLPRLAQSDWKDPIKRTALVNLGKTEALDRYKSVLAQLTAR